jgi:hypothetical protein
MNTRLKCYFLEEIQRIKIEDAILSCTLKREDDILKLDDNEITELYYKCMKKQPVF